MRATLCAALLVTGCKVDLDLRVLPRACTIREDLPICLEAETHSDFAWVETNIFATNCSGTSCHSNGVGPNPPGGRIVLARGKAYETLMGPAGTGVNSEVAPERRLVVPGNPNASYLYFMMQGVVAEAGQPRFDDPPEDVGFMPQDGKPLCCQKIDAVARWIEAGALP